MPHELVLIALFGIATAVAVTARWLKMPYTVALVVAGLALGATHVLSPPHLTRELLYDAILPGLLFEAAFHLEFRGFVRAWRAVAALAVPGVVAAIALTAAVLVPVVHALGLAPGFGVPAGIVFAALISATDPIAVVAVFKSLGAPRRLATLVEAESLFNDGTAVVLFTLVLGAVTTHRFSLGAASFDFVGVVGIGAAIGVAIGLVASRLTAAFEDPMLEITLTTLAAYGAFVVAEHLHFSGVIATVTSGMVCGNYGARSGMSPSTRLAVVSFWQYVAFALNSVVFLLIGFEVHLPALLASWPVILVAYVAVTLGRIVVTVLVTAALRRTTERLPWSWTAVLTWGGLRGALSMVLALGLPAEFAHRELLVTTTFGVVTLSILLQGLTMGPLMRRLGLARANDPQDTGEAARGMVLATNAALRALETMVQHGVLADDVAAPLRGRYRAQAEAAAQQLRDLQTRAPALRASAERGAARHLAVIEKDALREAARNGTIGHEAAAKLLVEIDARLVAIDAHDDAPAAEASDDARGEVEADK